MDLLYQVNIEIDKQQSKNIFAQYKIFMVWTSFPASLQNKYVCLSHKTGWDVIQVCEFSY